MSETIVRFDSRDYRYKRPFGAVSSGTDVFFNIQIRRNIIVKKVHVVVKYDRHSEPAWYEMNLLKILEGPGAEASGTGSSKTEGDYVSYAVRVTLQDTGLYWYWFHIETDLGRLKAGRCPEDDSPVIIDEAESQDDPLPWQQTVYRRYYEEPEWIHGGVFYHIFTDRFAKGEKSIENISEEERSNLDVNARPPKTIRKDWGGMPRFNPDEYGRIMNNDFFGGNINGITEKLPYLSDLGVTCLYLSPVFEAYSNHKYDTADYMRIDPFFGTEDDLVRLCRECEKYDMRVILDGVFAHTGSDSVYFNRYGTYGRGGAWNDPASPYRNWYTFYEDGSYDSWWGIDTLPKVNKSDPFYKEFITGRDGVARYWLRKGVSGWRLDVADELPTEFLRSLSEAVHEEKSDALLIGEVWEDASNKIAYDERKNYFEGDKLDSVMDYPLKDAIISFVRDKDARRIAVTIERLIENYPKFAVDSLMNNLGTHDSIRIITALAGKRIEACFKTRKEQAETSLDPKEYEEGIKLLRIAVLLQMTLPGVPCIYYGDEAGMEGYGDPFNRGCYPWGRENKTIQDWYRRIIKIRREHKEYERGGYMTLEARGGLFVFARHMGEQRNTHKSRYEIHGSDDQKYDVPDDLKDPKAWIVTAVNMSDEDEYLPVSGRWTDLITDGEIKEGTMIGPGECMLLVRSS